MSRAANTRAIESLQKQLRDERAAHARTRTELQQELTRVWRLVPGGFIELMGVYPPLRKLLHILGEAADLQDPSRGAPIEDTARTEYVAVGNNASTSQTERGVLTHARARSHVKLMGREIEALRNRITDLVAEKTNDFANLTSASEWEYDLPDVPICWVHGCAKRGNKQPYSAWSKGCVGCGRQFETERTG
jgi:hypothetical protein